MLRQSGTPGPCRPTGPRPTLAPGAAQCRSRPGLGFAADDRPVTAIPRPPQLCPCTTRRQKHECFPKFPVFPCKDLFHGSHPAVCPRPSSSAGSRTFLLLFPDTTCVISLGTGLPNLSMPEWQAMSAMGWARRPVFQIKSTAGLKRSKRFETKPTNRALQKTEDGEAAGSRDCRSHGKGRSRWWQDKEQWA